MNLDKLNNTLYVSDLDGTLLGRDSQLSDTTVNLLCRLLQAGAKFTIATARTPATVEYLMSRVPVALPKIVMAGAAMWSTVQRGYTNVRVLPEHSVKRLCHIFACHGVHPFVYRIVGDKIIASHHTHTTPYEEQFFTPRNTTPYKSFVFSDEQPQGDPQHTPMMIFSMGDYARLEEVYKQVLLEQIPCVAICYHDIFDPTKGNLEIYAPGTSKAQAIDVLARRCGASRIVTFGDNLNDLPMLQAATEGIAVDNAVEEVRRSASQIIGPNTDDSVPRWIASDLGL